MHYQTQKDMRDGVENDRVNGFDKETVGEGWFLVLKMTEGKWLCSRDCCQESS